MHSEDSSDENASSTSSLAERVRSLNAGPVRPVPNQQAARQDDATTYRGLQAAARPESLLTVAHRRRISDPEKQFLENATRILDHSRTVAERSAAASEVAESLELYSPAVLMTIWTVAHDLTTAEASSEARKAGFILLKASAKHTGLDPTQRHEMFGMIVPPTDGSCVYLQIDALDSLTSNGRYIDPFAAELVDFLCRILETQYKALAEARRRRRSRPEEKGRLPEEKGLHALLGLISNMIKANPDEITEDKVNVLVSQSINVAKNTTSKVDMRRALSVIKAFLEVDRALRENLKPCIETLCAISSAVPELKDTTDECLLRMLRSRDKATVVKLLLTIILRQDSDHSPHTVCGALAMIGFLVVNHGLAELPEVMYSELMDAISDTPSSASRIFTDCLRAVARILEDASITAAFSTDDWTDILKFVARPVDHIKSPKRPLKDSTSWRSRTATIMSGGRQSVSEEVVPGDAEMIDQLYLEELRVAKILLSIWVDLPEALQPSIKLFFSDLFRIRPAFAELLIDHMVQDRFLSPSSTHWKDYQLDFIDVFFLDRHQVAETRLYAVEAIKDTMVFAREDEDFIHYESLFEKLVADFCEQEPKDLRVANALGRFMAVALEHTKKEAQEFLTLIWPLLEIQDTIDSTSASIGNVNTVSLCIVGLFLKYLETSAARATLMYDMLVQIAKSRTLSASVRLPAMRLLTRLRCDNSYGIMVITNPDTLDLAATLCRTEASAVPERPVHQADRTSVHEEQSEARQNRASVSGRSAQGTSRPNVRSASGPERAVRPTPPLWMYPGGPGLPADPPTRPSRLVRQQMPQAKDKETLRLSDWLVVMIDTLQQKDNWEIYSYVLVHLPSQLSNPSLFASAQPHIRVLRSVLTSQLLSDKFHEPPAHTGVKKGDVALCLFNSLIILLGYCEHFAKAEREDLVRTFLAGIAGWDRAAKVCIQALAICCHEIPAAMTRPLPSILQKMTQIITQSHLTADILEFLGGLARQPSIYVNFREEEYRTVFAICMKYLQHAREQRLKLMGGPGTGATYTSNRSSGLSNLSGTQVDPNQSSDAQKDLPQYVFALAYHVQTIWFLSLKLPDRASHVGWITRNLAWKDEHGNEIMEEQSQVTLDMMHRTAYLDLGETSPDAMLFTPTDGKVLRKSWLVGLSIVTVETAAGTGKSLITKRQASGTTYASYMPLTQEVPPHHVPQPLEASTAMQGPDSRINILPSHVFLQLMSTIAPTPTPMEPICLVDDESMRRAISSFDLNDTVDGYKVGVLYVGNGQTEEAEILGNSQSSAAFDELLAGLGTRVALRGARMNTQGLDRQHDSDGTHTYAWRDRVAEIIFHVPVMMPTDLAGDPQCVNKKRHVGNDFVNIIFNDSGRPYRFGTVASQFERVNIVITPEALLVPRQAGDATVAEAGGLQQYYLVQTISHSSFPPISPAAAPKLLPGGARLAGLVRQMALNAAVFSNVWTHRESGEHVSSWRNRLREIFKLRERLLAGSASGTGASSNGSTAGSSKWGGARGSRTYATGDTFRGRVEMGGLAEEEGVLAGLDFSRWAGPNPPLA